MWSSVGCRPAGIVADGGNYRSEPLSLRCGQLLGTLRSRSAATAAWVGRWGFQTDKAVDDEAPLLERMEFAEVMTSSCDAIRLTNGWPIRWIKQTLLQIGGKPRAEVTHG